MRDCMCVCVLRGTPMLGATCACWERSSKGYRPLQLAPFKLWGLAAMHCTIVFYNNAHSSNNVQHAPYFQPWLNVPNQKVPYKTQNATSKKAAPKSTLEKSYLQLPPNDIVVH